MNEGCGFLVRNSRNSRGMSTHYRGPMAPCRKQVFLPTKGREFVQAAANANNGKDVKIPQGGVHDPNNIPTWLGTWTIFIQTQKQ